MLAGGDQLRAEATTVRQGEEPGRGANATTPVDAVSASSGVCRATIRPA
jgi:hypothetical protein